LTLGGAIYSQIALFFALNCIFFSANKIGTVKQNNQSDFKVSLKYSIKFQENERQKGHFVENFATTIAKTLLLLFFPKKC